MAVISSALVIDTFFRNRSYVYVIRKISPHTRKLSRLVMIRMLKNLLNLSSFCSSQQFNCFLMSCMHIFIDGGSATYLTEEGSSEQRKRMIFC